MALDPQAAAILEAMDNTGTGLSSEQTPQDMREQIAANLAESSEIEVASVENRVIPGPGGDLPIRIYKPAKTDELLPGVVFFHGGGWVFCNLDSHDGQVRDLTNLTGAIFVSVDYRLAPENPFPAAPEDAFAATQWVANNAAELGIDASRLAVCGDSAGGNLSTVVAQMIRDKGGFPELKFQMLIYPCCDIDSSAWDSMSENAEGYFLTRKIMEQMYVHYVGAETSDDPYAAPIKASDLSNLPPALVITAGYDPLRDEGEAYVKKLQAAGVDAKLSRYDGMFHGFFGMADFIDKAKDARKEAADALKKALAK